MIQVSRRGALAAGLALLAACGSEAAPSGAPPAAGTSQMNVDNISEFSVEVTVDGQSRGMIAPFEVGAYEASVGSHEVVVSVGQRETDRATVTVAKGRAAVFNPKARGVYFIEELTYSTQPRAVAGPGPRGYEARGKKLLDADFGPGAAIPPEIEMGRQGNTVRTKIYRIAPAKFSATEAVAFLKLPRERFKGDGVPAAFEALLSARNAGALSQCLDFHSGLEVDVAFRRVWSAGLSFPDSALRAWIDAKAETPFTEQFVTRRAMHASFMIAERGQAPPPFERFRNQVFDFRGLFGALPPERAQSLFRAMMTHWPDVALRVFRGGLIVPDAETDRAIDAHIQGSGPGGPRDAVRPVDWLMERGEAYKRSGQPMPFDFRLKLLQEEPPGTSPGLIAKSLVAENRWKDLAAAYPSLKPRAREMLLYQVTDRLAGASAPQVNEELAFLDLASREKEESFRRQLLKQCVAVLRKNKDARLVEWAKKTVEREPSEKLRAELQSELKFYLK